MMFEKFLRLGSENLASVETQSIETFPQLELMTWVIDEYEVTVVIGRINSQILKPYSSKKSQSEQIRVDLKKGLQIAYPEVDAKSWCISESNSGRPSLSGPRKLDVSLSHSRYWVASAFTARGMIGIDVETLPRRLKEEAWGLFLDAFEIDWLRHVSKANIEIKALALWCAKEAYLKASQQAGKVSMKDIVFSSELELLTVQGVMLRDQWITQVWQVDADLLLALCLGRVRR
jgi:phosphopantetheinyl transferase